MHKLLTDWQEFCAGKSANM